MTKLTINEEKYPFRLELGAMRLYAIKKGIKKVKTKDLPELIQDADMISDYPILIWAGLKAGPESGEEKFNASVEDVSEWLKEDPAAFDRAMDLIKDDIDAPAPEGNEKEAEAKK